jgi:hypothetical protein
MIYRAKLLNRYYVYKLVGVLIRYKRTFFETLVDLRGKLIGSVRT